MKKFLYFSLVVSLMSGCSPLKTSLHDDRYQWELTLHEVQTNVDDLRHDTSCFTADMQILEGRMKAIENGLAMLKQLDTEKSQAKVEALAQALASLEKKWSAFEKRQESSKEGVTTYVKETHLALTQFKSRIEELESEIASQNRKLEAVVRLKNSLETLTKSLKPKTHKVKSGDSLEKIARAYQTDVVTLKKLNELHNDLIVIDQELTIP